MPPADSLAWLRSVGTALTHTSRSAQRPQALLPRGQSGQEGPALPAPLPTTHTKPHTPRGSV